MIIFIFWLQKEFGYAKVAEIIVEKTRKEYHLHLCILSSTHLIIKSWKTFKFLEILRWLLVFSKINVRVLKYNTFRLLDRSIERDKKKIKNKKKERGKYYKKTFNLHIRRNEICLSMQRYESKREFCSTYVEKSHPLYSRLIDDRWNKYRKSNQFRR